MRCPVFFYVNSEIIGNAYIDGRLYGLKGYPGAVVQDLVSDLMLKYGKDKPFHDDDLFNDIYEITGFPEIKTFVNQYIEGTEALPLKVTLQKVGLNLDVETGKISEEIILSESQLELRKQWIGE